MFQYHRTFTACRTTTHVHTPKTRCSRKKKTAQNLRHRNFAAYAAMSWGFLEHPVGLYTNVLLDIAFHELFTRTAYWLARNAASYKRPSLSDNVSVSYSICGHVCLLLLAVVHETVVVSSCKPHSLPHLAFAIRQILRKKITSKVL